MTTLHLYLGSFIDDSMYTKFRTLITRTRPVEVLVENNDLKGTLVPILKNSPFVPSISVLSKDKLLTYVASLEVIREYFGQKLEQAPETISKMTKDINKYSLAICALAESFKFLKDILLDKTTIPILDFHEYFHDNEEDEEVNVHKAMVLDAYSLEHLEIFEVQGKTKKMSEGSLFHFLDSCAT